MNNGTGYWELRKQPVMNEDYPDIEEPNENSFAFIVTAAGVKDSDSARKIATDLAKVIRKYESKGKVTSFAIAVSHMKGFIFR